MNPKRYIALVLAGSVPLLIYSHTVGSMAALWTTGSFRHGWVIPLVSLLLLWREGARYRTEAFTGSLAGVALTLALVAVWLVADATSVQVVEQLAVVAMVGAVALALTGWRFFRGAWFPFAFLLLAVPMGSTFVPALMDATASMAVAALQMLGVPALREGMQISLPGGTFEVIEACSGFNYLNAGVALGILVAHIMFRSPWRKISYVGAIAVVFILVNGFRAFVVMWIGSLSHMRWLVGKDHIFLGWVLFVSAMILMYWVAERFSDARENLRAAA